MDFLELAEKRFSVREFLPRPLERGDLERILRAGQLAPTGRNAQPFRVLVIRGEEALEKLRACTRCHFGAPAALLVCAHKGECWTRPYDGKQSGEVDAAIVTTHMMLEAADLGVGSCWVMHFRPGPLREAFSIPGELEPVALLVLGYPAPGASPSPQHPAARPLEELVAYDSFSGGES